MTATPAAKASIKQSTMSLMMAPFLDVIQLSRHRFHDEQTPIKNDDQFLRSDISRRRSGEGRQP